jgi:transcriptional regulator GlxA family with amidase domain
MKVNQRKTNFVFLILPHIHLMDLAGPDQVIHEAIGFGAPFEITYCRLDNGISTSAGLPIGNMPHFSTVTLRKGDFLVLPGSNTAYLTSKAFKSNRAVFKWIVRQYENGVNICSICVGAFVLAETGLLDGISCTTHFKKTQHLQELYPGTKVADNILFTEQQGIYTSAGIASGIDMFLHIIEKLTDSYLSNLVARELVVYNRRNGNAAQESELLKFRNHIHAGIHKVQNYIIENINLKTHLPDLAEIANMSERNFTRIFRKETTVSVNHFITRIRKERSLQLLKNPNLSRTEIANKVGLQSERQLSRILNS